MLTRAEARRMERLELDAIDALASLWAAAHPVATLDASTSVVAARLPRLQPAPDVPRKEKTGTDATIRRGRLPTRCTS